MPTKKFVDDQMLAIRSCRWSLPDDPEAFGFLLDEVTFLKEDAARVQAFKDADRVEEARKEQNHDK